jgi:hypothetical protein
MDREAHGSLERRRLESEEKERKNNMMYNFITRICSVPGYQVHRMCLDGSHWCLTSHVVRDHKLNAIEKMKL